MSSYFYGLVQQRGPWATTDVDILRLTQPRVTQSVVGESRKPVENRPISGVLAGSAGYGMGASTRWAQGRTGGRLDSLNGIVPSGEGMPIPVANPTTTPTTTPSTPGAISPASVPKLSNPPVNWDPVPFLSPSVISRTNSYNPVPKFSDYQDSSNYLGGPSSYKAVPDYATVQNGPISRGVPKLALELANSGFGLSDYMDQRKTGPKFDPKQANLNWDKLNPRRLK